MKKAVGVASIILLWHLAAVCVVRRILPAPADVFFSFASNPKPILIHGAHSIYRLAAGVALAVAAGLPLGILLGYYKKAGEIFSPVLYVLAPIPKIALLPVIMLFLGIRDASKIFVIFIIMVFQVMLAARDGVAQIPAEYFMAPRAARAGDGFILRQIVFPAAIPHLFTAIRVGLATSVSVLFFTESFGTRWGLGFYIMDMWMQLNYRQMYAGIAALGVIGLLSAAATDLAERFACPWAGSVHK